MVNKDWRAQRRESLDFLRMDGSPFFSIVVMEVLLAGGLGGDDLVDSASGSALGVFPPFFGAVMLAIFGEEWAFFSSSELLSKLVTVDDDDIDGAISDFFAALVENAR